MQKNRIHVFSKSNILWLDVDITCHRFLFTLTYNKNQDALMHYKISNISVVDLDKNIFKGVYPYIPIMIF